MVWMNSAQVGGLLKMLANLSSILTQSYHHHHNYTDLPLKKRLILDPNDKKAHLFRKQPGRYIKSTGAPEFQEHLLCFIG